jgi:hypothetical protein
MNPAVREYWEEEKKHYAAGSKKPQDTANEKDFFTVGAKQAARAAYDTFKTTHPLFLQTAENVPKKKEIMGYGSCWFNFNSRQ